jgi:hypothetical protein
MNRAASKSGDSPSKSKVIAGLPNIRYYPPLIATLSATLFVFLIAFVLTLIAIGNTVAQSTQPSTGDDSGSGSASLLCGVVALVGLAASAYFLFALIKGVRDLFTPLQYTRGSLADKRVIGGRFVGNWLGVVPSYIGPSLESASTVSDEEAATSADRSQIVQTRNTPPAPADRRRSPYLSPGRISSTLETDPLASGKPDRRSIFRADPAVYEALRPGEQVLVAHSRFLEHIYYIAHLRDGEWESNRNKALI